MPRCCKPSRVSYMVRACGVLGDARKRPIEMAQPPFAERQEYQGQGVGFMYRYRGLSNEYGRIISWGRRGWVFWGYLWAGNYFSHSIYLKMKKLLVAVLCLLPAMMWADPWDDLTLEEAKAVVAFLADEPYVLDYCDCCDAEGEYASKIYLMRVVSTEIVACEWNDEKYSVKAQVKVLAEIAYTNDGPDVTNTVIMDDMSDVLTVTMNYTWVYHDASGLFAPFFAAVDYGSYGEQPESKGVCRSYVNLPPPHVTHDESYASWWEFKSY